LRSSQRGSAFVELAVAIPLLAVVLFAVADFARAYYVGMELTNAARAGAQYGSKSTVFNAAATASAAQAAAPSIAPYTTPTVEQVCTCTSNSPSSHPFPTHSCTSTCASSSDHLLVYTHVVAQKTFTTITRIPGIPSSVVMTRSATMRAQ
jgi:Flp pilus assembly protein TadG